MSNSAPSSAPAGVFPYTYAAPAQIATGSYTGDGSAAAVAVQLGFTPVYVKVWNMSSSLMTEWIQGMASTPSTATIISMTATSGVIALNTSSQILSNGTITVTSEVGVYAPATQEPSGGTLINTSLSVYGINKANAQLSFGATVNNVASALYVWVAMG